jgi:putative ubiquitin-RnfH superfamily antitoxin RatB of RatAB toxin-antitoxin module
VNMKEDEVIAVEVAYALPNKQQIIALKVEVGTTALQTVQQSGIGKIFPDLDIDNSDMGVFGKSVKPAQHIMQAGERIEIYRPLILDPKEVRKLRAEKAKAARGK